MERLSTPTLVMVPGFGCVATSGVRRSERMRREPAFFLTRSHICKRGTEPMIDTVEPIGIVGTGRVAQALGRLLTENGQPVAGDCRPKSGTSGVGSSVHRSTELP